MLIKVMSKKHGGYLPIYIAQYPDPTMEIETEARTFIELCEQNPNFIIETTAFYSQSVFDSNHKDKEFWENFAYPSSLTYNMDEYTGDTWTFSNGYSGTVKFGSVTEGIFETEAWYVSIEGHQIPIYDRAWGIAGIWWPMPNSDSDRAYRSFIAGYNSASDYASQIVVPQYKVFEPTEWQKNFYSGIKPESNDPFNPGGDTETGGGGGDFDNTSTPIEIPDLPSISAASTGFISLFNPSLSQLNELASYLWSDLFEIDGWKKLFADPMDAILGLSILPVAVPSGGAREVKVGNIGTGISLTVAASQFVEVDCGSIDVNEYWGAYLDYEPYTQAQIFLPYIGTRPISVDEIMGKTVRVVYHVDILTGACCCFVKCGASVLYTYNGQCSIPIPITGANYTSVVNGVISIAASVGSLVATGGASAPVALPSIANSAVNQMKPQVEKSGSISGSAGVLNMQVPYLILIRPRQALPSRQNEFIGYPSLITVQLTELSGYTEIQSIHLENIPATKEELAEIQSLLEGGVIF